MLTKIVNFIYYNDPQLEFFGSTPNCPYLFDSFSLEVIIKFSRYKVLTISFVVSLQIEEFGEGFCFKALGIA